MIKKFNSEICKSGRNNEKHNETHPKMSERARRARPRVGIVYSESDDLSNESKYLAHFLLAKLILTNHATVSMIALKPNGAPISNLPNTRRVSLHVAGKPRAVEVPVRWSLMSFKTALLTPHANTGV